MTTPMKLNDNVLIELFENCTLEPSLFTHLNQLRISWLLIDKHGLEKAVVKYSNLKEQYYIKVLKSNKFNLALTKAYIEILHHFMERSTANDFDKLMREFPRLKFNFKELVKTHYGYNILKEHRKEEPNPLKPILFTF